MSHTHNRIRRSRTHHIQPQNGRLRALIIGSLACAVLGCGQASTAPSAAPVPQPPTATAVPAASQGPEWKASVAAKERFSADFPGVPTQQQATDTLVVTQLKTEAIVCSVFTEPLPAGQSPARAVQAQRADLVAMPGQKVLEEKQISVGGHPGIEIKTAVRLDKNGQIVPGGVRIDRVVATSSHQYQVTAVVHDEARLADGLRFLDSFKPTD